jgi:2-oxo-3-(phosphooxy)propyl 3-oxoalkanoate synthase
MMTADELSPPRSALRFAATVPRAEVHKRAIEEVLLTDSEAVGERAFVCAAQLPQSHRTYVPAGSRHHDLLLLLEVVRQATILGGHRHLGIPADRQFLMRQLELVIDALDACQRTGGPAEAIVHVTIDRVRHIEDVVARLDLQGWVSIGGMPAATGAGTCMCLAPEDYRALRDGAGQPSSALLGSPPIEGRADPAQVGRSDRSEVVVAALQHLDSGAACAEIVVDPGHPSFFDHPLDHVPATLILEAGRQVAHATRPPSGMTAVGCKARFAAFGELGQPLTCRARADASGQIGGARVEVGVVVTQDGREIAEIAYDMAAADVR